jgi:hypothetical protein
VWKWLKGKGMGLVLVVRNTENDRNWDESRMPLPRNQETLVTAHPRFL